MKNYIKEKEQTLTESEVVSSPHGRASGCFFFCWLVVVKISLTASTMGLAASLQRAFGNEDVAETLESDESSQSTWQVRSRGSLEGVVGTGVHHVPSQAF